MLEKIVQNLTPEQAQAVGGMLGDGMNYVKAAARKAKLAAGIVGYCLLILFTAIIGVGVRGFLGIVIVNIIIYGSMIRIWMNLRQICGKTPLPKKPSWLKLPHRKHNGTIVLRKSDYEVIEPNHVNYIVDAHGNRVKVK